jgi:hypothetical protein
MIEAKIGQARNGLCGLQRKDLWINVFLTMLKVALRNVRLAPKDVPPRYRVDCVAGRRVLPRERFRPLALS